MNSGLFSVGGSSIKEANCRTRVENTNNIIIGNLTINSLAKKL